MNKSKNSKTTQKSVASRVVTPLAAAALILSSVGGFVAAAHADTSTVSPVATTASATKGQQGTHQKPAAMGTVTAVNGDSITLTDKQSGTTYTVDATNATIKKMSASSSAASVAGTSSTASAASTSRTRPTPTTITVSDIVVGDTLMVQGTVSGTTVTATSIMDGQMMGGRGGFGGHGGGRGPGVQGTITAVNGTTLTVTGKNGTTYTVDGSAATASKMETISVSQLEVGDTVGIEGTVTGDAVTAQNIMDGMPQHQASTTSAQ
jgi:hypothetical protein